MSYQYEVKTYKEKFEMVELTEAATRSRVLICPERGGIALQCRLNGYELFYLDEATFLDPEANIRGGNPVLFPISGQLANGEYEWNGRKYRMRNHGVARTEAWEIAGISDDREASVTLRLRSSERTLEQFPFEFELLFTYTLKNGELSISQQYRNLSDSPMPMYPGFHPYFAADAKNLSYRTDATRYLDYNDGQEKPYEGSLDLGSMKESAALLDAEAPEIAFKPSGNLAVRMRYSGSFRYVVLWSVEDKPFVCVEPWMALNGELNRQEELVLVQPGEPVEAELVIGASHTL
ncbi:aldose epimerase [Paenibacillus sp. D9]|uniref:aldose epimerase family protein n=1 Tax=Paenibacillus TaxID=44249 RepID=UPI00061F3317|nr:MULTISPECIES: aldose epimerase [Paenibacillus]KKC48000.1 aldose epimerase [Paenibacillus sp. D9]